MIHAPPNQIWMRDSIKKLPGAGGAKGQKLVENGILTVADMKEQDDAQLLTLASTLSSISLKSLSEWRDSNAQPDTCPCKVLDYMKYKNSYRKRYGATWEEEKRKTVFMQKYMCIQELVQNIYDWSEDTFQGTVNLI